MPKAMTTVRAQKPTPPWAPGFKPFEPTTPPHQRVDELRRRAESARQTYMKACEMLFEATLEKERVEH